MLTVNRNHGKGAHGLLSGLPWEWESVGFPMGIPIWDGNGNDFKPMGIPTCGFCGFLWVFLGHA